MSNPPAIATTSSAREAARSADVRLGQKHADECCKRQMPDAGTYRSDQGRKPQVHSRTGSKCQTCPAKNSVCGQSQARYALVSTISSTTASGVNPSSVDGFTLADSSGSRVFGAHISAGCILPGRSLPSLTIHPPTRNTSRNAITCYTATSDVESLSAAATRPSP